MEARFGAKRVQMPRRCPDCGQQMSVVKYDRKHWQHLYGSASATRHYRDCTCGCIVVWGYPNVFRREHVLPLFNDRLVLQVVG